MEERTFWARVGCIVAGLREATWVGVRRRWKGFGGGGSDEVEMLDGFDGRDG